MVDSFNRHELQSLFVASLVNDAEGSTADFVLEGIAGSTDHSAGLLRFLLVFLIEGVRGLLPGPEDSVGCHFLRVGECVIISVFDFGVDFAGGGGVFECDGLDGFLLLEVEGLAVIAYLFVFGQGGAGLVDVHADLLPVLVHLRLYSPAGQRLLLPRSHLQLYISNHRSTIIL